MPSIFSKLDSLVKHFDEKNEKAIGNKINSFRLTRFLIFLLVKIHFPAVDSSTEVTKDLKEIGAKLLNSIFIGFPERSI